MAPVVNVRYWLIITWGLDLYLIPIVNLANIAKVRGYVRLLRLWKYVTGKILVPWVFGIDIALAMPLIERINQIKRG